MLPASIRPHLPWYHWSRLVGFYRRATETMRRDHSPEEFKFRLYGTVAWTSRRDEPMGLDLVAWDFYAPMDPEDYGRSRVVGLSLTQNVDAPDGKRAESLLEHPLHKTYVGRFLDTSSTDPVWYSQEFRDSVGRSNVRVLERYNDWVRTHGRRV